MMFVVAAEGIHLLRTAHRKRRARALRARALAAQTCQQDDKKMATGEEQRGSVPRLAAYTEHHV